MNEKEKGFWHDVGTGLTVAAVLLLIFGLIGSFFEWATNATTTADLKRREKIFLFVITFPLWLIAGLFGIIMLLCLFNANTDTLSTETFWVLATVFAFIASIITAINVTENPAKTADYEDLAKTNRAIADMAASQPAHSEKTNKPVLIFRENDKKSERDRVLLAVLALALAILLFCLIFY